jgi:hypothetical protein
MNKFSLAITFIAALCLLNQTAKAQTDSTHYDLGRIRLNKQFTQAITVKGADLERSPFTNLADALNVWFYGINTNASSTVYVIDGVMVNDVNAYSIYDIEEASLIQDAVVQLNGAFQHTQLVSITTRRHLAEKSGITAAAQANIVKKSYKTADNSSDNASSATGIYQQYYLSAFKNTQTSHMGISANYQHDVIPGIRYNSTGTQSTSSNGDPKFGLGKFYAYADHTLFTGTVAGVKLNYATQKGDGAGYTVTSGNVQQYLYDAKQNLFNAEAYVDSKIAGGFTNYLSFTYSNSVLDNNSYVNINISGTNEHIISAYHNNSRQYYLKDNLGYKVTLGQFTIQPSVNFTYRRPVSVDSAKAFISDGGGAYNQTSQQKASQLTLTPSVDVTYKNIFNIQGGFTQLLSTKISYISPAAESKNKALPFVTGSVNSANLFSGFTVNIYGSYSKSTTTIDGITQLGNISGYNTNTNLYPQPFIAPYNVLSDKTYNAFSYGVKLALPNDKLTLGYRYEKRDFDIPVLYYDTYGNTYYNNTGLKYNSHRVELAAKLIQTDNIRWTGNLNASHMKADYAPINGLMGIYQDSNNLWTGGWANRVDYNKLFAGADLLYMFRATKPSDSIYAQEHNKAFSLQNVFVGYTFNTLGLKNMQVYINARNIAHPVNSPITDDRYFFGAGIKATL